MLESTAALSTHPMSGTPANILVFFRGIPLLPPLAKTKAATCRWSPALTCIQTGSCPSCSPLSPGRHLFLEAMKTLVIRRFFNSKHQSTHGEAIAEMTPQIKELKPNAIDC